MISKLRSALAVVVVCALMSAMPGAAAAQDSPWSMDVSIGWDNAVSGDFLTGAIGSLLGSPFVVEKQNWDDVYGTGLILNIAAGYALGERSELRGGFTYQSAGSDDTLTIGAFGGGPLAASFGDYSAWGLDGGYRLYFAERAERWRPYAGASLGFGRVNGIDVDLAQTSLGVRLDDVGFYGGNTALTFGVNGGVLYHLTDRLSLDGRLGLRYVSGLSNVDDPLFSGLDDVNSGSSRWSLPLTVGLRARF